MATMKRIVASLWVCFGAYCGYQSNTAPLTFGMTVEQASAAMGVPLVHYSGHGKSQIYVAYGTPAIPGFYRSDSAIALQFRNGHLTGWKKDWQMRRPQWPF
jgi:hypothetical protein